MVFRTIAALAAGVILAACGASDGGPRAPGASADIQADPWGPLLPWDAENSALTTTDTGLQYLVLSSGAACDGGPKDGDRAIVHYEGKLPDGTMFDSSLARQEAISFAANRVIRGWTEALGLMCPGDEWMLYLPSDIAYGETGAGATIGPNQDLIFRVKLLAHVTEEEWTGSNL